MAKRSALQGIPLKKAVILMADVKWIKITTDMFDNRKIRHLRRLPDGNNIVLIWVMLLTMAGRCNASGMIFLTETIPYTAKMLADELDFEESTVKLALSALEQLGMITTSDNGYFTISGWEEHQNIEGMERIREQNKLRQKRWYDKQKELPLAINNPNVRNNVRNNVSITQNNATDIDKEIDIEIEKEYISVVEYLNEKAGTKYRAKAEKTKRLIHARLAEGFTVDDFKTVIDKKCTEWMGTEWEKFLRPETLFGTKFESYLNAKARKEVTKGGTAENPDDGITGKVGTWF